MFIELLSHTIIFLTFMSMPKMCSDFLSNGHDHLPLFSFPSSSTLFQALLLPSNDNKQIASGLSDRKQKLAALPFLDGSSLDLHKWLCKASNIWRRKRTHSICPLTWEEAWREQRWNEGWTTSEKMCMYSCFIQCKLTNDEWHKTLLF